MAEGKVRVLWSGTAGSEVPQEARVLRDPTTQLPTHSRSPVDSQLRRDPKGTPRHHRDQG